MTAVKTVWGPAAAGRVATFAGAVGTYALDDADDMAAGVLCFPKDGTITHVGFYIPTITGTPPAYNVGLVTVDTSGNPTTTAYGGSTNTTTTQTTTGWKWIALAGNATAAAGDFAAVRVWPTVSAPDASNRIYICNDPIAFGGSVMYYTTVWSVGAGSGLFAVKYDDNTVVGIALSTNTIGATITSATTPDEVGCAFTLPVAMTAYGIRTMTDSYGTAGAYEFIIYNSSNTAIATCTVSDKDFIDQTGLIDVYFDAVNLAASTTYRVVVKPTVSTNGSFLPQRYQFESAEARAFWPHGDGSWQYTSRTDGGAWTDVSTDLMYIGLWVSDITFGSSGGGGEFAYIG